MEDGKRHIVEEKKCPNPECGAMNKSTAKICIRCGHEFKD
jgi:hypothetical protein